MHFVEMHNLQVELHNLARVVVRYRSGICKLCVHDFEIVQHNLQIALLHKSCATLSFESVNSSRLCMFNG